MLLAFIDETGDVKDKEYLGFSLATVNARFYPALKKDAHEILYDIGWDPSVEFKGSYLFSESKGCEGIDVEQRVNAAHRLIELNMATSNSRMKFYYGTLHSSDHTDSYMKCLPLFLAKTLPKAPGSPKNLIVVSCDERSDVNEDQLNQILTTPIESRGYVIHERIQSSKSSFDTVGLMFADLVGYLAARIDTITNDSELFDDITPEKFKTNGKLRKLRSSTTLISKIKQLQLLTYEE